MKYKADILIKPVRETVIEAIHACNDEVSTVATVNVKPATRYDPPEAETIDLSFYPQELSENLIDKIADAITETVLDYADINILNDDMTINFPYIQKIVDTIEIAKFIENNFSEELGEFAQNKYESRGYTI